MTALAFLLALLTVGPHQAADTLTAVRLIHPSLVDARAVAVDPFGSIFIVDSGRDAVLKLSPIGAHLATFGGPGSRDGEFDEPADIDPTNGMVILVADAGNRRIQRFSRTFAFLGSIPLPNPDERRSADPARIIYRRSDSGSNSYDSGIPIAIASTGANELFAVDADQNVVIRLDEDRRAVRVIGDVDAGEGLLNRPVALAVSDDLLYVADAERMAVLVYDTFGSFVRSVGEGRLPGIRALASQKNLLYVALARQIVVYGPSGLTRTIDVDIPEDIVDFALKADGEMLLLTPTALYRLTQ